jgi:HD-like signal output (HDOD) protein
MRTILLVEEERALPALKEAVARLPGRWQVHKAISGREALDWLTRERAQVILAALLLPDMDGAPFLQEAARLQPGAIRLALGGESPREQALKKGCFAHQILPRPCAVGPLEEALERALVLRDLLTSEPLQKLVAGLNALPSLPTLYRQFTEELCSEDPALDRVGEIVSRDAAMSAKLLQQVNSAFFGLGGRVVHPTQAVIYLGLETVKGLVLSYQIFAQFNRSRLSATDFSHDALWSHCWTTGVRAHHIAQAEGGDASLTDQSFVSGLLHDVGKLILACERPELSQRAFALARLEKVPLAQAEKEVFGCSHAELGAFLLHTWHLPDGVVQAVALHHRPGDALRPAFSPLTVVHAANALDHRIRTGLLNAMEARLDFDYLRACGVSARLEDWWSLCLEQGAKRA